MSKNTLQNALWDKTLIGFGVRGTIGGHYDYKYTRKSYKPGLCGRRTAGTYTYRLQPGNGFFGTKRGTVYQHKYPAVVPTSINNPQGDHSRAVLAAGVLAWQALSDAEKNAWRNAARRNASGTGYNLFISTYMKENL